MKSPDVVLNLIRRFRSIVRSSLGNDVYFARQTRRKYAVLGGADGYGAWPVILDGLSPRSIIYSAGIGTDISFDLEVIRKSGATVHGFDPTPASLEWLGRQPLPPEFRVYPWGLANTDGTARLYPHVNPDYVSHSLRFEEETASRSIEVDVRRVASIMAELGHKRIDILKMDIEGAEYDVLEDILSSNVEISQILVEFHHRAPGSDPEKTRRVIQHLNAAGYNIFYTSPRGEEYGFVRE